MYYVYKINKYYVYNTSIIRNKNEYHTYEIKILRMKEYVLRVQNKHPLYTRKEREGRKEGRKEGSCA